MSHDIETEPQHRQLDRDLGAAEGVTSDAEHAARIEAEGVVEADYFRTPDILIRGPPPRRPLRCTVGLPMDQPTPIRQTEVRHPG